MTQNGFDYLNDYIYKDDDDNESTTSIDDSNAKLVVETPPTQE